jgi:NAD(P)H-hydrate epimerase
MVRLLVDREIYPIAATALAASAPGVMVAVAEAGTDTWFRQAQPPGEAQPPRFKADAALAGPGWGTGGERVKTLDGLLAGGIPVVLDADAIALCKGRRFLWKEILTPHVGEFEKFTGEKLGAKVLDNAALVKRVSAQVNAVVALKSSDMLVASPDGECALIEGGLPVLACGGSGDLLAGFTVGIAARCRRMSADAVADGLRAGVPTSELLFRVACAAGCLLMEAARRVGRRFTDPLEIAREAAALAGEAWLP